MTECCICQYTFFRGQTYSIGEDGRIYCANCLLKGKDEVDQCPRCYQTVEIKSCNTSRCNNCGCKLRDCSDLA